MKARARALVRALPPRIALPMLAVIGRLEWRLRPRHRAATTARMAHMLRGTSREPDVARLARRSLIHSRGLGELLWRYDVSAGGRIDGEATLAALRAAGAGAVIAHTHLCWIAPQVWALAAQGYVDALVLVIDDPPTDLQLHWQRVLTGWGVDLLPAHGSFDRVLAHLRQGHLCHIALDVPGSTPATFLDKPARLASGPAALAFAGGAPVVPAVPSHPGPGLRVRVGEPLRPEAFADAAALTRHLAELASADILAAAELYHDHEWLQRLWSPSS